MANPDDLIGALYSMDANEADPAAMVREIVTITGVDEEIARFHLEAANNNAELAVTTILESPQYNEAQKSGEATAMEDPGAGTMVPAQETGPAVQRRPTRQLDPDDLIGSMFNMQATEDDLETILKRVTSITGADPAMARQHLEASGWNVETASATLLDEMNRKRPSFDSAFEENLDDVSEDQMMPAGTNFTKAWLVRNTGTFAWPAGCALSFVAGQNFGGQAGIVYGSVEPGDCAEVVLNDLVAPSSPGVQKGIYQLFYPGGEGFGDVVVISIVVTSGFGKQDCWYGAQCTNHALDHRSRFAHPTTDLAAVMAASSDVRRSPQPSPHRSPHRSPVVSPFYSPYRGRSRSRSPSSSPARRTRSRSRESSSDDEGGSRARRMEEVQASRTDRSPRNPHNSPARSGYSLLPSSPRDGGS